MHHSLNVLEQLVLIGILNLKDQAYGAAIFEHIVDRTKIRYTLAAVHAALKRLESGGYLTSKRGQSGKFRSGRKRRYFTITASGVQELNASLALVPRMRHRVCPPIPVEE